MASWTGIVFSPDSEFVATGLSADTLGIWPTGGGKPLTIQLPAKQPMRDAVFAPDNRSIALALADNSIALIELATGKPRQVFGKPPEERQDGRIGARGTVAVARVGGWTSFSGAPTQSPNFAFSPDGRLLAQGRSDHSIVLWDVVTGKEVARLTGHQGPVQAVLFAPDGRTLASGSSDTTALVWDVKELVRKALPRLAELAAGEVEACWAGLLDADAAKSFAVIGSLAASPTSAIPLLREKLKPVETPDPKRLASWIAALDSDEFTAREQAREELEKQGELAIPALRKALAGKPTEETRRHVEELLGKATNQVVSGEHLRQLRAIEVLERMNTLEARKLLQTLAKGAPSASQTQAAQAALKCLGS
jgi:hypothetical protein